ncbi:hypothetical protein AVEN_58521-1 [Araneus ventricosus]|uniref:THAP-type domain-containing protein n=1 Tax=Araneus ventricosus TaxID=182803 RepID=A0A4Y2IAJ1_ARAVE|nr:hypothetical protein AVEN_58521-1 [Araneus ventricosus]
MPSPCCVPGCRSNYKKNENVSLFSFPRNGNLKKSWITAIKRQDFIPTKHSRLEARVYIGDQEINKLGNFSFPLIIDNSATVIAVLDNVKNVSCGFKEKVGIKGTLQLICDLLKTLVNNSDVNSEAVNFLMEQVAFLGSNKFALRYSSDIMIFSSLMYTISPSAYRFLRQSGYLVLPHPNTINHVCTKYSVSPKFEQMDSYFLLYIKQKFKYLEEKDKVVILMLDEVHIKEYFDYKGGSISGMSYDSETSASSAQVFIVKSIVSQYKDVVHVLPVHTISGNVLHEFIKKREVELFIDPPELSYCYPHPVDKSRPLFFVVDPVHLFKCIRNNWLNQKNDGRCFFYPKFDSVYAVQDIADFKTARFTTIRELYNLESDKLVKYGFRLNLKALVPSSMERQNVKLVLCIFNEHVAEALAELGEKNKLLYSHYTSDF